MAALVHGNRLMGCNTDRIDKLEGLWASPQMKDILQRHDKTSEFLPSSDENTDALEQILFEGIDDDVFVTEEPSELPMNPPVQQPSDSSPIPMQDSPIARGKRKVQEVLKIVVQHPEPQTEDSRSMLQPSEAQAEVSESGFTPCRSKRARRELRRHLD